MSQLSVWSVGLMDKASAPGAGDSRFESWADHKRNPIEPPLFLCVQFSFMFRCLLSLKFLDGINEHVNDGGDQHDTPSQDRAGDLQRVRTS